MSDKPVLVVDSVSEWEAWLAANTDADADGVRLRLRKKASARPDITYDEALAIGELLAHGRRIRRPGAKSGADVGGGLHNVASWPM